MKYLSLLLVLAACGAKIPERERPVTYRNVQNINEVATTYANQFAIAIHTGREEYFYTGMFQLTDADTGRVYFDFSSGEYLGIDLKTLSNCEFNRLGSTLSFKCDGIPTRNYDLAAK